MDRKLLILFVIALSSASALASSCGSPKATTTTFTTQDATILTQLAHIAEISLNCGNDIVPNLFAEFPCGRVVPAAHIGDNKYQLSWTEDIKKASGSTFVVRLFDEEGYANVRRAQRDGDKVSNVKSLVDVTVTTKNTYKGPWVKAEIIAAFVVAGVAYFAYTTKCKIEA